MIKIKQFVVGFMATNCYLVYKDGSERAILIDPGRGFNQIETFCLLNKLNIEAILLTHGHFDHILDAKKWQDVGKKLYIHTLEENKLHSDLNLASSLKLEVPPTTGDVMVNDGDVLNLADMDIKVIHTPGHSAGSVCFIIEDCLFSGDTLFKLSYGRTDFPDSNFDDLKTSLNKLFEMDTNYKVYPGHDDSTELFFEKKLNPINMAPNNYDD